MSMKNKAFTTKRAEHQANVRVRLVEASAGREAVRGFTLVETLVAVTIITVAISGALLTANSAIVSANTARDQLTASYLAQEGIEYVRILRDNAYLEAYRVGGANVSVNAWANFLTSATPCRTPRVCTLGPIQGGVLPLVSCPAGDVCTPAFSLVSGGTPFSRTVQTVSVSATDEKIISRVSWSFHGIPYSVTINDHLTPWQ